MPKQSKEQIFRDIEEPDQKKPRKPGIEIARGSEELESVTRDLGDLISAVEHDEPVTLEQLSRLERDLDNLVVDIGGTRMTLKEVRKDLKKNAEICKEMKQGDFSGFALLTFLFSYEVAEILSKQEGPLNLSRLRALSDQAAESLSKHKGDFLSLNGLKTLSNQAAESLSRYKGALYLLGLTTLSDQVAESLSKHKEDLGLSCLKTLSDQAAESLSRHEGDLNLSGLTTLSDQAAESLSRHKGKLTLRGLTTLSDQAAESLSKHGRWLDLSGLTTLSDQAAESLARCFILTVSPMIQDQINKFKKR